MLFKPHQHPKLTIPSRSLYMVPTTQFSTYRWLGSLYHNRLYVIYAKELSAV